MGGWWAREPSTELTDNPNIGIHGAYRYEPASVESNGFPSQATLRATPPNYLEPSINDNTWREPAAYWNSFVMGNGFDCAFRFISALTSAQSAAAPHALDFSWYDGNLGVGRPVGGVEPLKYLNIYEPASHGVFKFNTSAGQQKYGTINRDKIGTSSSNNKYTNPVTGKEFPEPQSAIEEDPISKAVEANQPIYQRIRVGMKVNNLWNYQGQVTGPDGPHHNNEDGSWTGPGVSAREPYAAEAFGGAAISQNDGITIEWAEPTGYNPDMTEPEQVWYPQFQPNTPVNKYYFSQYGIEPSGDPSFAKNWNPPESATIPPYGASEPFIVGKTTPLNVKYDNLFGYDNSLGIFGGVNQFVAPYSQDTDGTWGNFPKLDFGSIMRPNYTEPANAPKFGEEKSTVKTQNSVDYFANSIQTNFNGDSAGGYSYAANNITLAGAYAKAPYTSDFGPQTAVAPESGLSEAAMQRYRQSLLKNFMDYDFMDKDSRYDNEPAGYDNVIIFYSSIWNIANSGGNYRGDWYAGLYDGLQVPDLINYLFADEPLPVELNDDFEPNPVTSEIIKFSGFYEAKKQVN